MTGHFQFPTIPLSGIGTRSGRYLISIFKVILSFEPEQGKYIKSYPIHESQVILADNQQELRIKLTIFITHDLVMEILLYGMSVRVISPEHLVKKIKAIYTGANALYART